MNQKVTVLDYGAGNLFSVANALTAVGADFELTGEPDALAHAERILLPGVGHFAAMMWALDSKHLREPLTEATRSGTPLLGICLGMQALFDTSEEAPGVPGLGLIPGSVVRLPETCRIPHMGWNIARFVDGESDWYTFANSFVVEDTPFTWATTEYGVRFSSAVKKDNLSGFQFHPEKSGRAGLALLEKWCNDAG